MKLLYVCFSLAGGEYLASHCPGAAEAWAVPAIAAIFVLLFGYALSAYAWQYVFMFLIGVSLFLHASLESERAYRECPWMRGVRRVAWADKETGTSLLSRMRRDCLRRVALGLEHDREVTALNHAILLGERSRMPRRMKRVFTESGSMHVFAISGLHVLAVAHVLIVLTSLLFIPRRWAGFVSVPVLWGYVILIGSPPSAVRAAMMASFSSLAPVFWRRSCSLRSWALTFLSVHLVSPLQIVDVGSALSFAVMLAIVLATEYGPKLKGCRAVLWVTFAAWVASVPISAHIFGSVTPGGIIANLFLVSAAEWAVMSGVVGLLASCLSISLAIHLNNASALFTRFMVVVAEGVSRMPASHFVVGKWTLLQCAEWYLLVLLVICLCRLIRSRRTL